jgi:DNA-binding Lrp family transcriptional regulator
MTAVWELDLPPQDKFILLAFADHADDSGYCYPSFGRIAWKCGVSRSTIKRFVRRCRVSGVLEVLSVGVGRNNPSRYRVQVLKGVRLDPFVKRGQEGREKGSSRDVKGVTLVDTESSFFESSGTIRKPLTLNWKISEDGHAAQCLMCRAELPNSRAALRRHRCAK